MHKYSPASSWRVCARLCSYYRRKYDVIVNEQLVADEAVCTGSGQTDGLNLVHHKPVEENVEKIYILKYIKKIMLIMYNVSL